ncbi:uncharacterized protein BKA55DRAFT_538213 [Fusarium redolens]|uniref:Uncharacterized protein n=1 Tax=Fusarium redolens TaxID=48865 RepID=A0A9P9HEX3_FUSRE|nr:uncharacterized protein BKA55DRAFT_538213 [Fusarium redolens]KAH7255842.1 hypothetical protein BKA55DRAFT_538213 [Fusarium redolens]
MTIAREKNNIAGGKETKKGTTTKSSRGAKKVKTPLKQRRRTESIGDKAKAKAKTRLRRNENLAANTPVDGPKVYSHQKEGQADQQAPDFKLQASDPRETSSGVTRLCKEFGDYLSNSPCDVDLLQIWVLRPAVARDNGLLCLGPVLHHVDNATTRSSSTRRQLKAGLTEDQRRSAQSMPWPGTDVDVEIDMTVSCQLWRSVMTRRVRRSPIWGCLKEKSPRGVFSTELNGAYSIGIKDEEGTCLWSQERGNIKYMAPACP